MTTATSKLCCICGMDVSATKRTKDAHGRYYCESCRVKPSAGKAVTPAVPGSEATVASAEDSSSAPTAASVGTAASPTAMRRPMFIGVVAASAIAATAAGWLILGRGDTHDVLVHPEVLLDPAVDYREFSMAGVHLGDVETSISVNRISKPKNDYGWIECKDGSKYKIDGGRVVMMRLTDAAALTKIGLTKDAVSNRNVIPNRFGQASRVDVDFLNKTEINDYYYDDRHLAVSALGSGVLIVSEASINGQMRSYLKSCDPFIQQVKALQADLATGINIKEFGDRLRQLNAAYANLGSPPNGDKDAAEFKNYADECVSKYGDALKTWRMAIEGPVIKDADRDRALKAAEHPAQMLLPIFESMRIRAEK